MIPSSLGGDGPEMSMGGDGGDRNDAQEGNSCYPSYKMLVDRLAPIVGFDGESDCAGLVTLFDTIDACRSAKNDQAACSAKGDVCVWNGRACGVDPGETIKAVVPTGDSDLVKSLENSCKSASDATTCAAASTAASAAAEAAVNAAATTPTHAFPPPSARPSPNGSEGGTTSLTPPPVGPNDDKDASDTKEDADVTGPSADGPAASGGMSGGAVFFTVIVLLALVGVGGFTGTSLVLKSRGRDVCEFLPDNVHKYVPGVLRPEGVIYSQQMDRAMELDDL